MDAIRSDLPWLAADESNVLVSAGGEVSWWTFAGGRANAALAHVLGRRLDMRVTADNFVVKFPARATMAAIEREIWRLAASALGSLRVPVSEAAREALKFGECLQVEMADRVVQARLADPAAITGCLGSTTRTVIAGPT